MRKIRVMFVIGSLHAGGSERQVVQTLKVLSRERFQPLLYAVYRDGELVSGVPHDIPIFSYWDRHPIPRFSLPGMIRRRQARDLAAALESEQVELICDRNFEMTLLAAAASRIRPTRRVSFVSADPELDLLENAGPYRALKRRLLNGAYKRAERVVGVSEGVSAAVREYYGLPPEHVVTIHSFVDSDHVRRLSTEFEPPLDAARFNIVSVGRLDHQKGYPYLIEAVGELVHQRGMGQLLLWIIGRGRLRDELEQLVRGRRLEGHVRFAGFQPNPFPYMKGAQLFCLPSLYEGMPNSLEEAVACEVPVLACDCPSGPAEVLDRGRFGRLVPPGNSAALAEAIADAVANYHRWQALTAGARDHLERNYSIHSRVAALEDLFESVAAADHLTSPSRRTEPRRT